MNQLLRRLLLIAALLFSQHAALLHGMAHAEHEVALASHDQDSAPALDHGLDDCAAFGVLAQALGNAAMPQPGAAGRASAPLIDFDFAPAVTRVVFDSRAPPLSA